MKDILASTYKNKFSCVSNDCVNIQQLENQRVHNIFLFDSIQLILQVYQAFVICIPWTSIGPQHKARTNILSTKL
jgi:hypothetical protein